MNQMEIVDEQKKDGEEEVVSPNIDGNNVEPTLPSAKDKDIKLSPYFILYLIPLVISFFIFLQETTGIFKGACGKSCELIHESVFGSIFGVKLSYLGLFFYIIPIALITNIHRTGKFILTVLDDQEKVTRAFLFKLWLWRMLVTFAYASVGFEVYLMYTQLVIGEVCITCTTLAMFVFIAAIYVLFKDLQYDQWKIVGWAPRLLIVVGSFLLFSFAQHPHGSFAEVDSPEFVRRQKLYREYRHLLEENYAKPWEQEPYGERVVKSIAVINEKIDDINEKIDKDQVVVDLDTEGMTPGYNEFLGKDEKPVLVLKKIDLQEKYNFEKLKLSMSEGDVNAPIKIVVWLNYWCSQCQVFNNYDLEALRNSFVKNGSVYIQYRYVFPQNSISRDDAAFISSVAALEGRETWKKVHMKIFETQSDWMRDGDIKGKIRGILSGDIIRVAEQEWSSFEEVAAQERRLYNKSGVERFPTTFFYDNKTGKVLRPKIEGSLEPDLLEEIFLDLVNKVRK